MPFDSSFDDTYKLGIQAACKEAGAYCERVDEQVFQGSVLERIYNQISRADIIVADMTGKNPNVFYETGYAHALGKRTILLTKSADDIPFDLKHYVHIVHQGKISDLKKELKRRVKHYIEHPEKKTRDELPALQFCIESKNIDEIKHVQIPAPGLENPTSRIQDISFDIHNPNNLTISLSKFDYGIVFPSGMGKPVEYDEKHAVRLPDGNFMILKKPSGIIYPKSWHHNTLRIHFREYSKIAGSGFPCALRIFDDFGMREIPFWIFIRKRPAVHTLDEVGGL